MKPHPKLPPIRVVREPIDGEFCAVLAFCFRIGRRRFYDSTLHQAVMRPVLYGLSVFTLVVGNHPPDFYEEVGRLRLIAELGQRERLPRIGLCSDLAGWADYE